jgi:hypothetical protein
MFNEFWLGILKGIRKFFELKLLTN